MTKQYLCAVIVLIISTALLLSLGFEGKMAITFAASYLIGATMTAGLPDSNRPDQSVDNTPQPEATLAFTPPLTFKESP